MKKITLSIITLATLGQFAYAGGDINPVTMYETEDVVMATEAYEEAKNVEPVYEAPAPEPTVVVIPPVVAEAGLESEFEQAVRPAEEVYWKVREVSPLAAQYLVTHAHNRRVVSKFNLRECYHLFKMRTSEEAHFSIREPMEAAMRLAVEVQPQFFRNLQLRSYPEWWPHPVGG